LARLADAVLLEEHDERVETRREIPNRSKSGEQVSLPGLASARISLEQDDSINVEPLRDLLDRPQAGALLLAQDLG
jgi:hypothetical protein